MGIASASLAGCSSGDGERTPADTQSPDSPTETEPPNGADPTETPTRTETVSEAVEPEFDLKPHPAAPDTWDLAPYSAHLPFRNYAIYPTLSPFGANAANPDRDYEGLLIEENELLDRSVWRYSVAEGFTWHDGSPVTVEDRFYRAKYDTLYRQTLEKNPTFETVERTADRTIEQTIAGKRHPVRFHHAHRPSITHKAAVFEPHVESMADATSKREGFLVHQELTDASIPAEEWLGHGQFQISDTSPERVLYTRHEGYPDRYRAAQNIETLRLPIQSAETTRSDLVKSETTDWFLHVSGIGGVPDSYTQTKKLTTGQVTYRFNHTNKHLARLGVRRAIAYRQAWQLLGGHFTRYPDEVQDGTTPAIGNRWIPDYGDRTSKYLEYGTGPKPNRATAELESEGYERDSEDKWVGPDGDRLEITLAFLDWNDFKQQLAAWLNQFGMTATVGSVGGFNATWASYESDWDMVFSWHSRGPNHPAVSYGNDVRWGVKMSEQDGGQAVPVGNRDLEYELPTDLGATDLSGETETVNVADLQARVTDPDATAEDLVEPTRKLSWWWNYYVPDLVTYGKSDHFVSDQQHFEWRDWNGDGEGDGDTAYKLAYGLNAGYVRGKPK